MGGEYERETSRPLRTAGFSCASSPPYRAAFSRGELAALRALFTDGAEVYSTEALPNAGRFKCREGYLEWVGGNGVEIEMTVVYLFELDAGEDAAL